MLRLKQIQERIQNPPSDSKTKDGMMDEFDISPEEEKRILDQIKARKKPNVNETEQVMPTAAQPLIVAKSNSQLEIIRNSLAEKCESHSVGINETEKKMISDEINRVQFPYAVQNFLFYINAETAKALARSTHPIIKEWGNHCTSFYAADPLNKHVQPETGLVVAQKGGINHHPHIDNVWRSMYTGNGVWNLVLNSWVSSPGSSVGTTTDVSTVQSSLSLLLYTGAATGYRGYVYDIPAIKPPDLSKVQLKLIAPIHVAALIGDKSLIQSLIAKGARIDDDNNHWHMTPLDMAILSEQTEIIDFLLQKTSHKAKALKLAVEKNSFSIIEKLVNGNAPITDDVLEAAKARDHNLYFYLDMKRKANLDQILTHQGPFKALLSILSYPEVPLQMLVSIICAYPDIINTIENGNTILHRFISDKNISGLKAYLSAIFTARCMQSNIPFNIEKKNSADKTVLQLALESGNKDIITAVMLYGNPSYTSLESQLASHNINIAEIMRERSDLMLKTMGEISQRQQTVSDVALKTNVNVGVLALQQENMGQGLMTLAQVTAQNCNEIKTLKDQTNLSLPYEQQRLLSQPATPLMLKAPPAYSEGNTNLLFESSSANEQKGNPTPVVMSSSKTPAEELESIRETINALKNDIRQKSKLLESLEQRVASMDSSLIAKKQNTMT